MEIRRDIYLNRLKERLHNGFVKIITGIHRCGKSYLLFRLFRNDLIANGVSPDHIIEIALDNEASRHLRNPIRLAATLRERISNIGKGWKYVFIDEIQMSQKVLPDDLDLSRIAPEDRASAYVTFYDVLNELMKIPEVDVYVTGSNSRTLSSDIATNFRDRGDEVRIHPLTFGEYHSAVGGDKSDAWADYLVWGGMPGLVEKKTDEEKKAYLDALFKKVYLKDIVERHGLKGDAALAHVLDFVMSSVGSLTNPTKLANSIMSMAHMKTSSHTVGAYLDYLQDAFLVSRVQRYDVKGRHYLDYPSKYYAEDVGLRNGRVNFRQAESGHLMENVIYNELMARGCSVDVGMVEVVDVSGGRRTKRQHEIDFIVNRPQGKVYLQSAFSMDTEEKVRQETTSLLKSGDFFRKIVIVGGAQRLSTDENGISYVGVLPFLLDPKILGD